MPLTWNLNHHTVVSKTTIVRSCVPPWGVLYWFISVPDGPYQFVAILKFFYQFSNLPSTSLSSLATHTWEDEEGTEDSTKMFVIVNWWKIGYHLEIPSFFILNFLQTFTCPKMVSEIILWSQPFSPLPHTIPLPSIILHYYYTIIMIWEQWWMKLPSPVL